MPNVCRQGRSAKLPGPPPCVAEFSWKIPGPRRELCIRNPGISDAEFPRQPAPQAEAGTLHPKSWEFYTPEPLCAGTCAQGFGGVEFRGGGGLTPQSCRAGWEANSAKRPGARQGLDLYDGLDSRPSYRFRQGLDLYDGVILRLGEGRCEVMTDPGGIRAEKRGLALLVICIPTRKQ